MLTPEYGRRYVATSPAGRAHRIHCVDVLRPGVVRTAVGGETIAALGADPPYCSGGSVSSRRSTKRRGLMTSYDTYEGDSRSDDAWLWWSRTWLLEVLECSHPETYVFMWTDWAQEGIASRALQVAGWLHRGMGIWDKTESSRQPHKGYLRHQAEAAHWGTAGQLKQDFSEDSPSVPGVFRCKVDSKKIHRHQKPVAVWKWLFEVLGDERPGIVVDLFGGSLSALLAADELGRRSVTFERSPAILAKSFERLIGEGYTVEPATKLDEALWLIAQGKTLTDAAARLGLDRGTLYKRAANDNVFAQRLHAARANGGG